MKSILNQFHVTRSQIICLHEGSLGLKRVH